MKVLVTGGTGEIGRPALTALVTAGHTVQVTSRSDANDRLIISMGALPVRTNLFDRASVLAAVSDAEAIVHLATRIPAPNRMADLRAWEENDRLRREATKYLVAAALRHRVSVMVLQSYFAVRAPAGPDWIDDDPTAPPGPWSNIPLMTSMREAELAMRQLPAAGIRAVILRFGSLYSETSDQLRAQLATAMSGMATVPGDGANYWPFLASRDAGCAVCSALSIPSGTYHVADNEPVPLRRFWQMVLRTIGGNEPPLGGAVDGPMAPILLGSWRVRNAAFRTVAHWKPERPSVLEGWPEAAERVLMTTARGREEVA